MAVTPKADYGKKARPNNQQSYKRPAPRSTQVGTAAQRRAKVGVDRAPRARAEGTRLRQGDPFRGSDRGSGGRTAEAAGAGAVAGDIYGKAKSSSKGDGSIGALEAEFLGAIGLIILTLFTDSTNTYSDKMLKVMKQGTLTCAAFFVLALVANIGPNSARAAKAFGALMVAGILLNVGASTALTEIDSFFKGDWTASSGNSDGSAGGSSGGAGGGSPTSPAGNLGQAIKNALDPLSLPEQIYNGIKNNFFNGATGASPSETLNDVTNASAAGGSIANIEAGAEAVVQGAEHAGSTIAHAAASVAHAVASWLGF